MTTNYEQTQKVHDLLMENLMKEEARLQKLLEYERDVALQIEDATRVILGVKRCIATLSAGIPRSSSEEEKEYRRNMTEEEVVERMYNQAVAKSDDGGDVSTIAAMFAPADSFDGGSSDGGD